MKRLACLFTLVVSILILGHSALAFSAVGDEEAMNTSRAKEGSDEGYGIISGNVALTSDYVFRGQSQTDHQPAIQGGLDWAGPYGIYVGAWGSNVHFADSPAALELQTYVGIDYSFARHWTIGSGVNYYSYFRGSEGNTWEIPLRVGWKKFKAEVDYAPIWGNLGGSSWYISAGWADKIIYEITLGLNAGYSFFGQAVPYLNYADFRIAVSRELLTVNWEIATTFVSREQFNGADQPRLIFTASKSF